MKSALPVSAVNRQVHVPIHNWYMTIYIKTRFFDYQAQGFTGEPKTVASAVIANNEAIRE
jgi:hypothetical protein